MIYTIELYVNSILALSNTNFCHPVQQKRKMGNLFIKENIT